MGRPKLEFTDDQICQILDLARKGCQVRTIASITGIEESTLRNRFSAEIKKQHALKKLDVINCQARLIDADNPTMAIWLGKQLLDQKDKQEVENTVNLKMYGQDAPVEDV